MRWQTIFGTAPTAVSMALQGAMADVDSEYQTVDTTTNTAGEARTVTASAGKVFAHQVYVVDRRQRPYGKAPDLAGYSRNIFTTGTK